MQIDVINGADLHILCKEGKMNVKSLRKSMPTAACFDAKCERSRIYDEQ